MGSDSNGARRGLPEGDRWLDIFAVVIYIPGPLGGFLDRLRRDLVPGCNPRAHVSVLPPRQLLGGWERACEQARAQTERRAPFHVQATSVQTFPTTDVVYLEIGDGAGELRRLHEELNSRQLSFTEPFAYHPHITLAQEIPQGGVQEVFEQARRRWQEYDGPRSFLADRAVFVRNSAANRWGDLAEFSFGVLGSRAH